MLPVVGTVCQPAVGSCPASLWECVDGELQCPDSPTGGVEICNGLDDNCNQLIDEEPPPLEGTGEQCVPAGTPGGLVFDPPSTCRRGQTICANGMIECDGFVGPGEEVCNGLDDNCDGMLDNMAVCPSPTDLCYESECVKPCGEGEFPCSAGYVCREFPDQDPNDNDRFCVADPCFGVGCDADEACDSTTGECVDVCELIMCPVAAQQCVEGFCVDCFDPRAPCDEGEICRANELDVGECVPDPCPPGKCQDGQICFVNPSGEGVCVNDCSTGCPSGERCDATSGMCVEDRCAGVDCESPQICDPNTGACEADRCTVVNCNPGQVCVSQTGQCIPDPCASVECPDQLVCDVDFNGNPQCVEDAPPTPPGNTVDVLATGGGGCACQVGQAGGGADVRGGLLLFLGVAVWLIRRRRFFSAEGR
jgi:MYXO-CTERM domain-containing protein